MSREIKFRGRNNNGQWVYGFYVARKGDHKTKHYIYTGKTCSNQTDWCEKYEVDPKTVGRFTGFKLKDEELYEGDRVEHSSRNGGRSIEIVWDNDMGQFAGRYGIDFNLGQELRGLEVIWIIGNIHEHCEHGKGLNDYCEPCGRTHGG